MNPLLLVPSSLFFIFIAKWLLVTVIIGRKNLPPSPPKLPVLGNLHQLSSLPHRSLQSLAQRHGPIMLLYFGSLRTIVVSSADAAREVIKNHDIILSDRPGTSISRKLMYDYKDIAMAPYGVYWRQMKSICMLQLLSAKRVRSFRSIREEEVDLLVNKIEQSCSNSLPINLSELFVSLMKHVVCRAALGSRYSDGEGDGSRFNKLFKEFCALLGVFDTADFIPSLAWIKHFTGLNARVDKTFKEFDKFLDEIVDCHLARDWIAIKEDQKDFVDVLLTIQKSPDEASFGRDSIKALILDMFLAGIDTTSTTLEWTMTELLRHPKAMNRLQEEIRRVRGSRRSVTEDDLDKMLYLKAVIKETLRLHPPLPLLIPRQPTESVKVQGYEIPAKTRVIINAWAVGRDPKMWEEADEFRPERFLESSIDFKGHDFQLIPFGSGRRGCPGITFATAALEIVLASMLDKFDWEIPDGSKLEDLEVAEALDLTLHPKLPLIAIATCHSF
ncbi:hypothetical protein K2173_001066 [Erythroxylum novogranatense]|uniref:Cytochrome P450 n=1 Tax=Erythroxylum novogranatense TaxID=1862640 RepID=A0AAV8SJG0_9ROSI|nr:hypothetical protein K2173_001066 [Erythroxylum novogranatense]